MATQGSAGAWNMSQAQLPHFGGFDSRKAAEFCGPSQWQSNCGAKNYCPSKGFSVLTGSAAACCHSGPEEDISLPRTPKIKALSRFSLIGLLKLPLPTPQGVVPKKLEC